MYYPRLVINEADIPPELSNQYFAIQKQITDKNGKKGQLMKQVQQLDSEINILQKNLIAIEQKAAEVNQQQPQQQSQEVNNQQQNTQQNNTNANESFIHADVEDFQTDVVDSLIEDYDIPEEKAKYLVHDKYNQDVMSDYHNGFSYHNAANDIIKQEGIEFASTIREAEEFSGSVISDYSWNVLDALNGPGTVQDLIKLGVPDEKKAKQLMGDWEYYYGEDNKIEKDTEEALQKIKKLEANRDKLESKKYILENRQSNIGKQGKDKRVFKSINEFEGLNEEDDMHIFNLFPDEIEDDKLAAEVDYKPAEKKSDTEIRDFQEDKDDDGVYTSDYLFFIRMFPDDEPPILAKIFRPDEDQRWEITVLRGDGSSLKNMEFTKDYDKVEIISYLADLYDETEELDKTDVDKIIDDKPEVDKENYDLEESVEEIREEYEERSKTIRIFDNQGMYVGDSKDIYPEDIKSVGKTYTRHATQGKYYVTRVYLKDGHNGYCWPDALRKNGIDPKTDKINSFN